MWNINDIITLGDRYYREYISLQENLSTQKKEYLPMMFSQSYFNNCTINLKVHFYRSNDGNIEEDKNKKVLQI